MSFRSKRNPSPTLINLGWGTLRVFWIAEAKGTEVSMILWRSEESKRLGHPPGALSEAVKMESRK